MLRSRQVISIVLILIINQIQGQEQNCGKRLVDYEPLITSGLKSNEGDWPWHAAIYHITIDQNIAYKCGGTLLTSQSVLTAAHCVYENGRSILPTRVIIHLGQHNLKIPGTNTQFFEAYDIISHSDYNQTDYSNDIAVIRLATKATFNNYVQPICLWDPNKVSKSKISGNFGTVIGWGVTEKDQLSHILRHAVMPIVPSFTCLRSNREFFGQFLSEKNFCAGFANGTSVCNGDSGGSLSFEDGGVYRIRGIVSLSVSRTDKNLCNSKEYVIFTDVEHYLPWIKSNVAELLPLQSDASCKPDEFHCTNWKCVPLKWTCDFDDDCGDGSDENIAAGHEEVAKCNKPCNFDQFKCGNEKCIDLRNKCNQQDNCGDGSDEDHAICGFRVAPYHGHKKGIKHVVECPSNGAITGLKYWAGAWINSITFICNSNEDITFGPYGNTGGSYGEVRCPAGKIISSIYGHSREMVEQIGIRCREPNKMNEFGEKRQVFGANYNPNFDELHYSIGARPVKILIQTDGSRIDGMQVTYGNIPLGY